MGSGGVVMRCTEARPLFSLYLDGAVTGVEMQRVSNHLDECSSCKSEYVLLENTRDAVAQLGRKTAPPDLAYKLRIAIASERSRKKQGWIAGYVVRLENALNAVMFPATAGILTAVLFFAAVIVLFVVPQATADDVPTMLYIP